MKILEVKYKVHTNQCMSHIKIIFQNTHLLKVFDTSNIKLLQTQERKFAFQIDSLSINFICSSLDGAQNFNQSDLEAITGLFSNLRLTHVKSQRLEILEDDLKQVIKRNYDKKILGFKQFSDNQGHFMKGDYLFCSKESIRELVSFCQNLNFNEFYLFPLDNFLKTYCQYSNTHPQLTQLILDTKKTDILLLAERLNLILFEIGVKNFSRNRATDEGHPIFSIAFRMLANASDIHIFYLELEQLITNLKLTFVRLNQNSIPNSQFQQEIQKIYGIVPIKLNNNTIVFLGQQLTSDHMLLDIKQILRQKMWQLNQNQEFTTNQIQILQYQYRSKKFEWYLKEKCGFLRNIQFSPTFSYIKIKCDSSTKDKFIQNSHLYLKAFKKVKVEVLKSDERKIETFKKYFQKSMEEKYIVKFFSEDNILFRQNYYLHQQMISNNLISIINDIEKNQSKILSTKPISQFTTINPKFFKQILKPEGYSHELLGCRLYSLDDLMIKVVKIEQLKIKKEKICFIFNDELSPTSSLETILLQHDIKLQSFFSLAHRAKKPTRLMGYRNNSIPDEIILLYGQIDRHLQKDIQIVLESFEKKLIIGLVKHEGEFFLDFLPLFFSILQKYLKQIDKNKEKPKFSEIDIYYENKQDQINKIERAFRLSSDKIKPKSVFCLSQPDLLKLYSMEYHQMIVQLDSKWVNVSPIIAQILHFELFRQDKAVKQRLRKKFVFSFYKQNKSQLIQFVINTKSDIHYKVIHGVGIKKWSRRPKIERILQLQPALSSIIEAIKMNCFKTQYIILSAKNISDLSNKIKLQYCQQFYIAFSDETKLTKIIISREEKKLLATNMQAQFKIRKKIISQWYEIKGYKDQIDLIQKQLQG